MTLNKDLLERVAQQIEAHPETFDMQDWDCGTTACIAGWAARLSGKSMLGMDKGDAYWVGVELIGLDADHQPKADALFAEIYWPDPFFRDFQSAIGNEERAEVAAARIRHFIQTDGRE